MGVIRSQIGKIVRPMLVRRDLAVVPIRSNFGGDVFADIRRLADIWHIPIDLIFDVGANDGETALKALKEFSEAKVLSFEPHPATFARLIARVGGNPRFRGVNVALGAEVNGEAELFEYGEESRINSLTPNARFSQRFDKRAQPIPVKATTLDAFCSEMSMSRIDILKIDTEGFDLVILEHGRGMLQKRCVPFIYVEFNDLRPKEGAFGGSLLPFDELLRPYGYRFIASYNDFVITEGEFFMVSNALFALPPSTARLEVA
jgi:FkbM family methyltransferase